MSINKYFLIKEDISKLFPNNCLDWELKPYNVIQDVGTNMFVARSVKHAIENRYCQLGDFSTDLIRILIKHNSPMVVSVDSEIK